MTQGTEEATCAMNEAGKNPYATSNLYIPASLGEIYDLLGAMILDAPTFIDDSVNFRSAISTRSSGSSPKVSTLFEERSVRSDTRL